ncbi:hypothetical protein LTR37_008674 [Vermiconidia calcicola]|uniref:Uncharacterized protein n=1 Tax=Vermiconidia calcicola TaxID=1690605 RepID=A0ACC3NAI5_9PEZI|nr:hypothetical protein LTR37_008674 [Vermiconidia calcicola]
MPRSRVLSFMSQWGSGAPRSPISDTAPSSYKPSPSPSGENEFPARRPPPIDTVTPNTSVQKLDASGEASPRSPTTPSRARGDSKPPRPMSMLQSYNPPQVEVAHDTPPELQPIFSYLNSHSNKLYQEGYFLKLHDLDTRGRPSADRVWGECFAQLIGTVLSLWDAAALDVAGEDGEVVPTFVNLSDASIKMIESLPMHGAQGGSLQNVLSISTAANNRYLLHFNSLNSLTQWTAGIRLAMFEHTTLQEAYTGSLIAGKGRHLNNIKQIMFRTQFAHEDWARVRFGAGTAWQRCWCVISPPDEKEYIKSQKTLKKSSAYGKVKVPKGEIRFYDTRKVTKKTKPLATISDAYAAYAIYPQSKPLIDQSTLVKLEGLVTVHGASESANEGFVFVMPEVHAAVSGFEMMLRWLFPVFDTFGLYGRPNKLIADTLDQRGLMFAMPTDRRYGYLDILDVSSLIHTKGSQAWSERQWRRELKKLTGERMNNQTEGPPSSRQSSRRNTTSRASMQPYRSAVRFGSVDDSAHSTPGSRSGSPARAAELDGQIPRTDSAPPGVFSSPHKRSVSDTQGFKKYQTETPSRLSYETSRQNAEDLPPPPPMHAGPLGAVASAASSRTRLERIQSGEEVPTMQSLDYEMQAQQTSSPLLSPPAPVRPPPAFTHQPNSRPENAPYQAPELRRAHSNVDAATLYQMQDAVRSDGSPDDRAPNGNAWNGDVQNRQQNTVASSQTYATRKLGVPADSSQGVVNRKQRDPRQRLSTIPGSPYVGDDTEVFQSPVQMAPQMDGVVEERQPSSHETPASESRPGPPVPLHSSHSIARKPVPRLSFPDLPEAQRTAEEPDSPTSVTNTETWEGGYIDEAALERVLGVADRTSTMQTTTTESSVPDYASTVSGTSRRSPKKSIERPRAGKLKTVGDPDLPAIDPRYGGGKLDTWSADQVAESAEVPGVDFGPTYVYKPNPNSRPGTSGTLMPGDMAEKRRSRSSDRLLNKMSGAFGVSPRPSPNESARHSYFGGMDRSTPSSGGMTPDGGAPGNRTSMIWQPAGGMSPGGINWVSNSVTPEQWVQQRAAQQQQQYAAPRKAIPELGNHSRSSSMHVMRKLTKTPPVERTLSGDWTRNKTPPLGRTHSGDWSQNHVTRKLMKTPPLGRTMSGDWTKDMRNVTPPNRPSSRGAAINLDTAGQSLTAREQMLVSRATGSPLINMVGNGKKQEEQHPGMVGYVAARERDKAASKEGRNSMAVQQAIVERQQQQMRMEAEAQQQQYQMQMQAQQQQLQQQQMQQAMGYNNMVVGHNQNQMPMQYGGQQQQRPQIQNRNSWQGYPQQPTPAYSVATPGSQYFTPGATPGYGVQQPQGQYSPSQQQTPYQQPYGASYFQQQQQQQQQQGQQWARR